MRCIYCGSDWGNGSRCEGCGSRSSRAVPPAPVVFRIERPTPHDDRASFGRGGPGGCLTVLVALILLPLALSSAAGALIVMCALGGYFLFLYD